MPGELPKIVYPDGRVLPFDKARLNRRLRARGLDERDRASVALRVAAELRTVAAGAIKASWLQDIVDRAVGEVRGHDGPPVGHRTHERTTDASLGQYFSWTEFARSEVAQRRGIDNHIPANARSNIRELVRRVLDPVREDLGEIVRIRSGYRCERLNRIVGGAMGSQHLAGMAADISCASVLAGRRNAEWLARQIVRVGVPFDQLIWYHPSKGGHVHVSYDPDRARQRAEVLYRSPSGYSQRRLA